MIVGCYTLDLYCDAAPLDDYDVHRPFEFPHQFTDERGGTCRRQAERRGWKLNRATGQAVCPKCAKAGRKATLVDGEPA